MKKHCSVAVCSSSNNISSIIAILRASGKRNITENRLKWSKNEHKMINDIEIKWIKLKRGSTFASKELKESRRRLKRWCYFDNMLSKAKLNENPVCCVYNVYIALSIMSDWVCTTKFVRCVCMCTMCVVCFSRNRKGKRKKTSIVMRPRKYTHSFTVSPQIRC